MTKSFLPRALAILALGLTFSAATAWNFRRSEANRVTAEIQAIVNRQVGALNREMARNLELVYALKNLFNDREELGAAAFHAAASDALARHNDVKAVEWAPRIMDAERERHEAEGRSAMPGYQIIESLPAGVIARASRRPEYFPIRFVEPSTGNEDTPGYDIASQADRAPALEEARDTGHIRVTRSVRLLQEKPGEKGFLIILPVYRGEPDSTADRRRALRGFLLAAFRAQDFVTGAIRDLTGESLSLSLVDDSSDAGGQILYRSDAPPGEGAPTVRVRLPEFASRHWSLLASPTEEFLASRRSWLPGMTFFWGMIVTGSFVLFLWVTSRHLSVIERQARELNDTNRLLEHLSLTDQTTGVANRRHFDERLETEWRAAFREATPISLLMIDIDHFKPYNDRYGHQSGDWCLASVAGALAGVVRRPRDLVARYGGEEFCVILPGTGEDGMRLAEECRKAVERLAIPHENSDVSGVVTVSVGVSSSSRPVPGTTANQLLAAADAALYKAKEMGRNRTMFLPMRDPSGSKEDRSAAAPAQEPQRISSR